MMAHAIWKLVGVIALACCSMHPITVEAACQSCLILSSAHHHQHSHRHHQQYQSTVAASWGRIIATVQTSTRLSISEWRQLAVHRLSRTAARNPALVAAVTACGVTATCVIPMVVVARRHHYSHSTTAMATTTITRRRAVVPKPWLRSDATTEDENNGDAATAEEDSSGDAEPTTAEDKSSKSPVSTGMISTLGFYKAIISPLLPPACRFLPTCSMYGVQAIEEFGSGKGSVLIAWRLLRCSPFGGKGIDYPEWPPVSYTHGSWT